MLFRNNSVIRFNVLQNSFYTPIKTLKPFQCHYKAETFPLNLFGFNFHDNHAKQGSYVKFIYVKFD